MRYTYGILNRLERLADKVIDLNGNFHEIFTNNIIDYKDYSGMLFLFLLRVIWLLDLFLDFEIFLLILLRLSYYVFNDKDF